VEHEGSLPHSKELVTYPYPKPHESNPIYTIQLYFFKTHFNITNLSTSESSKWYLFFRFPHQIPASTSLLLSPCPSHPTR